MDKDSQGIILRCLRFIYEGNDIEDPEFFGRLGVTRDEVRQILAAWPGALDNPGQSPGDVAINNAMNEVCHGIDISPDRWNEAFSFSRDEAKRVYAEWLTMR